jgi:hypothetical protein
LDGYGLRSVTCAREALPLLLGGALAQYREPRCLLLGLLLLDHPSERSRRRVFVPRDLHRGGPLAWSVCDAPTLSTHFLRDPQERRYIEVDHFHPFSKARASLAREAIVANRLSRFVDTDVKRFKESPSLLAFWRRLRKLTR